jgi:hypothetical protein
MVSYTIEFTDEEIDALSKLSAKVGVSLEEIVRRIVLRQLPSKGLSFKDALTHTMDKNEELYKKLA